MTKPFGSKLIIIGLWIIDDIEEILYIIKHDPKRPGRLGTSLFVNRQEKK